ncbi:MAG: NAD(+) synthase [Clostridia bacterium]|nr:NAD(+) synthase [Clostridia bacterium]
MRDYRLELEKRVAFIQKLLAESGAKGIVYGNSGGKDSVLVGILCKKACPNTLGIAMPCGSSVNFGRDMEDAKAVAEQYGIDLEVVDLTAVKQAHIQALEAAGFTLNDVALTNIAPRLRMTTLYAAGAAKGYLVAGTGNRSERYMGYFTKWGDGAFDFNPISDLTVTEIYEFLRFLEAPAGIIEKAPSAGLFEGQSDEADMGVTYAAIDRFLTDGEATEHDAAIIRRYHSRSAHKRRPAALYAEETEQA